MGYGLHNNFGIHACKFPPLYQLRRQFKAPDLRRQSSWWLDENTCGGKYMWTLTERTTNAGIWKATSSESSNSAVSYVDGNEIEGLFCSRIYYPPLLNPFIILMYFVNNHLYMMRSKNPNGPWEKWNGSSWGGNNPMPIEHTLETPKNLVSANQVWLSLTIRFISTIHGTIKRSVLV